MEEKQYGQLTGKLDNITRLLATLVVEDKNDREAMFLLSRVGFQPKEIAEFLGTTPNTVRVTLSNLKKSVKKKHK